MFNELGINVTELEFIQILNSINVDISIGINYH